MESPMHNLMITSAVANDGTMMVPYIVDHTENADGEVLSKTSPTEYRTPMTAEEAAILKEDMISVVAEGSGYRAASEYAQVAGKTGYCAVQFHRRHACLVHRICPGRRSGDRADGDHRRRRFRRRSGGSHRWKYFQLLFWKVAAETKP